MVLESPRTQSRPYRDPTGLKHFLPGAPWPILHKAELKPLTPEYRRICGRDYVFWKDNFDQVHALSDKCPHWGASLSRGKVKTRRYDHLRAGDWSAPESEDTYISCPWHAIEFGVNGSRWDKELDREVPCPSLQPLDLIETHGIIWTYAGFEPKVEIPPAFLDKVAEHEFILTNASLDVDASVEDLLLINHDYDHQNGTHGESFKITSVEDFVFEFDEADPEHTVATFETPIAPLSLRDVLEKPIRVLAGKRIKAKIDNFFPGLVVFQPQHIPGNEVYQVHLHYPVDERRSHTSLAFYATFQNPLFKLLAPYLLAQGGAVVVEEDAGMFNERYYRDKPRAFRLPHEKGAEYIWRRFAEWPE